MRRAPWRVPCLAFASWKSLTKGSSWRARPRGAQPRPNHIRSKKNSHIIALDIKEYISADQPAEDILREIRRQNALSIACHPHHRTTRRVEIGTCYLWDHRKRLVHLVDVWEAANRDFCSR